jgi:hypothetical protein
MAAMARQIAFKFEVREAARALWNAHNDLNALKKEADALDYGQTLETNEDEPTAAELLAVAYDTNTALATMLANGHATNIAKVL